jgi:Ca-activated chloride channel family protein
LDYDLVVSRVADVTTALESHIKDGTAIGVAMANAAGKLKDSTAKTKVLIFLTDGENNSGLIDPETGLEIVKGFGIKAYSIGLGRSGPTKIPIYQRDVFGNRVKTYQPFESTVNDDLLGRMASETGGKYYRASKEDSLGPIFKDIDQLEKTKMDVNSYTLFTELYQKYLLVGFWLYVLGLLLNATIFRRAV